jgi:bifunctional non-homologous end joining protein LigD
MAKLAEYRRKRDFKVTSEPAGTERAAGSHVFVIQKHAATRLHYDLRLEMDGVLKSWAVPKGPSLDPSVKRLAVHVEDHPFEYRKFEGQIPAGQYGAGDVIIWDRGTYELEGTQSGAEQIAKGDLKFVLHGEKLHGSFVLVKLRRSERQNEWLLIKHRDQFADELWKIEEHGESVVSGREVDSAKHAKNVAARHAAPGSKAPAAGEARPSINPQQVGSIAGARAVAMPGKIPVTLARLAEKAFSHPDWLFEVKWDGVRTVASVDSRGVSLQARSGRDVTREYPEFQDLATHLQASSAILDGEIVVLDKDGRSNFERLQDRIGVVNPSRKLMDRLPLVYYVFDLLYCNGYDLRGAALRDRKDLLKKVLLPDDHVRYSEHVEEQGESLLQAAREKKLEGIIAKDGASVYSGDRTSQWLKFKIVNELDAVIGGWTAPRRSRKYFGALVLGLYRDGQLEPIGNVGTGFDEKKQKEIFAMLEQLRTGNQPFHKDPLSIEPIEWVKPELVARVKFANWTDGDSLRAPVFLSLRNDRTPESCTFEAEKPAHAGEPETAAAQLTAPKAAAVKSRGKSRRTQAPPAAASNEKTKTRRTAQAGPDDPEELAQQIQEAATQDLNLNIDGKNVHLTHLSKVYFPESGITKRDLLVHYCRFAEYLLPFLEERPLVLRRYPNGIAAPAFFQKEAPAGIPDWLKTATVYSDERGGEMNYVMAEDRASLLYLTNLGCIDHNPWSSRAGSQDTPDYVFFDLDPTPDTPFRVVSQVAAEIYDVLEKIALKAYLKTSGASGFHIFIPLKPKYTYEQTRTFAEVVGRVAAARVPKLTTFERAVRRRPAGTVLIDALQNARGKPLACAYSVRAFARAPVSTPLSPSELRKADDPSVWNVRTIAQRLKKKGDLWSDFWKNRQELAPALQRLDQLMKS